jgi:hypothetical protein
VAVAQVGQPRQVAGLQVEAIVVAGLHLFQPWAAQAGQSCRATIHLPVPEETAGQGTTCQHFTVSTVVDFSFKATDKRRKKISSYKEIQMEMRKYEELCKYLTIYEEVLSHTYMTLQPIPSEFPYI